MTRSFSSIRLEQNLRPIFWTIIVSIGVSHIQAGIGTYAYFWTYHLSIFWGTTYCRSDWRVAVDGVFGTSKRAQRSRDHPSRPKLNQRLGTISYSPNEQVQGKSQLSWNWIREPIQLIVRLLLGFSRVLSSACRWIISIIPFEKQK